MRDPDFTDLTSERLVIRRLHVGDRIPFRALRNIKTVARYQIWPSPYTEAKTHDLIHGMMNKDPGTIGEWFQFAVALRENSRFIGDIGLKPIKVPDGQFMLSYNLFPDFEGKGYMSEALRTLIDYAFDTLALTKALAYVDSRNDRSIRLLQRLGFDVLNRWENFGIEDTAETLLFMAEKKRWRDKNISPP